MTWWWSRHFISISRNKFEMMKNVCAPTCYLRRQCVEIFYFIDRTQCEILLWLFIRFVLNSEHTSWHPILNACLFAKRECTRYVCSNWWCLRVSLCMCVCMCVGSLVHETQYTTKSNKDLMIVPVRSMRRLLQLLSLLREYGIVTKYITDARPSLVLLSELRRLHHLIKMRFGFPTPLFVTRTTIALSLCLSPLPPLYSSFFVYVCLFIYGLHSIHSFSLSFDHTISISTVFPSPYACE